MARVCETEGCKKVPEYYCECVRTKFFCPKHIALHIKKIGQNHSFNALIFEVEDNQKEMYLKGIDVRCKLLSELKSKIKKSCSEIIDFTIIKCREIMKKLHDEKNFYNSIKKMLLQNNEMDFVEHEKGFILGEQSINDSMSISVIQNKITNFFQVICEIQNQMDDIECFWISGPNLTKVNLNTLTKSMHNLQFALSSNYNSSCKLPDRKFFSHSDSSGNCYILDVNNNSLIQIQSFSGSSSMSATGYIDGNVYIINGYNQKANEKYNITTKE